MKRKKASQFIVAAASGGRRKFGLSASGQYQLADRTIGIFFDVDERSIQVEQWVHYARGIYERSGSPLGLG